MAEYKLSTDEITDFVSRAKAGDTDAFGELYDCFVTPIFRYIYYRVDTRADAEDITEQVFLRAWEHVDRYATQDKTPFSAWLFRIAHNAVIDYYRSREKRQVSELDESLVATTRDADATDRVHQHFQHEELRVAIRKLPDSYQQLIVLRFINELEIAEVARVMKKSQGAIRVLQFRALGRLKELLHEDAARFVARWQGQEA